MPDVFTLLGQAGFKCRESARMRAALNQFSRSRHITLPSTFVGLWSLDGIVDFLHRTTNTDHPIPVDQLGSLPRRWKRYDPIQAGFLPFMVENQGVCTWSIQLNGGSDPPVYVEVDSGDPPNWSLHADSTTAWLWSVIWDRETFDRTWYQAQAAELTDEDIARLTDRFRILQPTYAWPGRQNLRLANTAGQCLLWSSQGQTDWFVAPVLGREKELLEHVLPLSELSRSLYAMSDRATHLLRTVCQNK